MQLFDIPLHTTFRYRDAVYSLHSLDDPDRAQVRQIARLTKNGWHIHISNSVENFNPYAEVFPGHMSIEFVPD